MVNRSAVHDVDPGTLDVDVRPVRSTVVVIPRGEIDLASVERVADQVEELEQAGFRHLVLDLRGVTFIDSSGLKLIVTLTRRYRGRDDASFRLIPGTDEVRRIFELTGLHDTLPFASPNDINRIA